MSAAVRRWNSGELARIASRSRNMSRASAMSAGDGLMPGLAGSGFGVGPVRAGSRARARSAGEGLLPGLAISGLRIGQLPALSLAGGAPTPKLLSVKLQSSRLNQSPLLKLFWSIDLLRSVSTPAWKYATPWLNASMDQN